MLKPYKIFYGVAPDAIKKILFIFLILYGILSSKNAYAGGGGTTYTWTGLALNGNWTTPLNWLPLTGYPGQNVNDIAVVNISLTTITLNTSLTISKLETTAYGITGVTVNLSGASTTLNISNGVSTAQPLLFSIVMTFSGTGTANISNTSALGYAGSMAVTSGATVVFQSNSILDFASNQGTLTNAGTVRFLSGSTFKIGYASGVSNSGTMILSSATFTMSGSPCTWTNSGAFNATSSTLTFSGSTIPITNSGTFTTNQCTVTASNTGTSFTNTGAWVDHGSNITFTGQNDAIANSGAASAITMRGTTLTFSSGNNGHTFSSAGVVTADSSSTINMGTKSAQIGNQGTFYAGTSNSSCIINLSGQAANISNTGTFYVGSTSGITMAGSGSAVVTSGTFTFQSDAYGSGCLGSVPSNGVITGAFNVQRYVSGGSSAYRGYRLFSSPVYASTTTNGAISYNVYSLNYVQNSALVTGSGGIAGGFDKGGNPSLYLYRENAAFSNSTYISGNFRGIANIASAPDYAIDGDAGTFNIPAGNGFLFWFRGNRTSNLANKYTPGTSAESVTMTAAGTLNVGQVVVRNWYNPEPATTNANATIGYSTTAGNTGVRGDNFVGNPYPSSIDWETFQTTTTTTGIYGKNVGNTIYVLNPTTQNYGAYMKGSGGVGTNNATNIIASGQGFFVTATSAASPQLIFNETAKSTSQVSGTSLLMSSSSILEENNAYLRLKLVKDSVNSDDIIVRFKSSASAAFVQDEDALYKQGAGKESLSSISSDNVALAINTLPFPKSGEKIPLKVSANADGVYQLTLNDIKQVPGLYDLWLVDAYKKDSINLRQNLVYPFHIAHADTASFGSKRFSLVMRQNPALAYQLVSFNALKVLGAAQVHITWTTANEGNYTSFTVERSTDGGKTFGPIGGVMGSGQGAYDLYDRSPVTGANYYRLKQEDIDDNITYSRVVIVLYSGSANSPAGAVTVYPNPAFNILNLNIQTLQAPPSAGYNITITTSAGVVVKQVSAAQAQWQGTVGNLLPGAYMITVANSKDNSPVGSTRFIKL